MMTHIIKKECAIIGICFIVSFITLLLFAISVSPISLFEGYDSCVFKQMGLAILQGKTPYVDLFDHKGPILYLINALGLWIGGRWGLFILCVLNFTFVLFFWRKIACLYVADFVSIFAVIYGIVMYISVMDEGNMTEDWSLLPLSYSLYLSLRMQKKEQIPSMIESYLIGVSAGSILFIRANNVALLVCSFILITYLLYIKKVYKAIFDVIICTFGGFLSVILLILVFFYLKYGQIGLEQMLYGTFIFNLTAYNPYHLASNSLTGGLLRSDINFFFFNPWAIYKLFFLFGIVLCIYAYVNNRGNERNKIGTFFLVGSFFFCFYTIGRNTFGHYLISTLPLFVVAISYTFKDSISKYILYIFIPIYFSFPHIYNQISHGLFGLKKMDIEFYHKADMFLNTISNKDKKNIWNYNAVFKGIDILQRNNIVQCNRIIWPFQFLNSDYLRKTDTNKLESMKPKYILLDPTSIYYSKEDSLYIKQHYIEKDSIAKQLIVLERRN